MVGMIISRTTENPDADRKPPDTPPPVKAACPAVSYG